MQRMEGGVWDFAFPASSQMTAAAGSEEFLVPNETACGFLQQDQRVQIAQNPASSWRAQARLLISVGHKRRNSRARGGVPHTLLGPPSLLHTWCPAEPPPSWFLGQHCSPRPSCRRTPLPGCPPLPWLPAFSFPSLSFPHFALGSWLWAPQGSLRQCSLSPTLPPMLTWALDSVQTAKARARTLGNRSQENKGHRPECRKDTAGQNVIWFSAWLHP